MYLIKKPHSFLLEEKKSKFISHLILYKDFERVLDSLKVEHPKARHFVYAFRYLNDLDQVVEACSDDGEPKNTSGKPTLAVLQGQDLINVAIITIRYFGGTKLGTGGLVRAYSDACNLAIVKDNLTLYEKLECFSFRVLYKNLSSVEYNVKQLTLVVQSKDFGASDCLFHLQCTKKDWLEFQSLSDRMIQIV